MIRRHLFSHLRSLSCVLFAALQLVPALAAEVPQIESQFDFSSETTPAARKFLFATVPGRRYTLWRSTDLKKWTAVAGYPQTATGLSIEHTFSQGVAEYFRIEPIDDQPPVLEDHFPAADGFAIRRFDPLRFVLSDATGVDPASISLTVGNGSALGVGSPGVTFANNVLTFTGGGAALGDYGATVPVTLTVADTLGHSLTHTFSFTLEVLPTMVANVFAFGSAAALQAGQQIAAAPGAVQPKLAGPVAMAATVPWVIESVQADRIVIAYTSASAPVFSLGQYLYNQAEPLTLNDIFYRKVLSVSDAPATKKLTLMTTDVPFTEIVERGSCAVCTDSKVYNVDATGAIQAAMSAESYGDQSMTFPPFGISRDNTSWSVGSNFSMYFPEAHVLCTPTLTVAIAVKDHAIQRASIKCVGDIDAALLPELSYKASGTYQKEWSLHTPVKQYAKFMIGWLPVWVDVTYSTTLKVDARADSVLTLKTGWKQNFTIGGVYTYNNVTCPTNYFHFINVAHPLEQMPLVLSAGGTATASVSIVPEISALLYSAVGFYVNADPSVTAAITRADASISFNPADGSVVTAGAGASGSLDMGANLNAGLMAGFLDSSDLPSITPIELFKYQWAWSYPDSGALAFTMPTGPQAVSAALGGTLNLEGLAQGGSGTISYQWLCNGIPILLAKDRHLTLYHVTSGNAGSYTLRARTVTETVTSPAFTVTISNAGAAPAGFALIPAGSFQMGDSFGEGWWGELPVHTVNVSAFLMGKNLVTKADWDTVRMWGQDHEYTDLMTGSGKAPDHPVQTITWYDMVKWCNARSEMERLTPCYTVSGAIYKTGQSDAVVCNWSANGHRLPTEAEWEKAARDGLSGKRFPWGDTITHSQANYCAQPGSYSYDVSPTSGNHPTYGTGAYPYTSPGGSFAHNGYGLNDMAGNVWEWCWDLFGDYTAASQTDPRGPDIGSYGAYRGIRGGYWGAHASDCRVAHRDLILPNYANHVIGFRLARGLP